MAQPYKHPQTGIYHLRRQIPEKLRAAFGGKALYKASLGTKDFVRASVLFTAANAELERQFEEARERLPAGRIRVSSSASYVTHILAPVLPNFLALYPDIALDIIQSDALADLVADRTDIAIRAGPLADSALVAQPLGHTALVVAAAPAWIERHGIPVSVEQLAAHDLLGFAYRRAAEEWLKPACLASDRVRVSDGEGIRQLALAGVAPARLAHFTIRTDLAEGRLVQLLPDLLAPALESFHAVYIGRSEALSQRVRVFLDHLGKHGIVS